VPGPVLRALDTLSNPPYKTKEAAYYLHFTDTETATWIYFHLPQMTQLKWPGEIPGVCLSQVAIIIYTT
jgi:hypothetical protein